MPALDLPPALASKHQEPAWALFQPPAWLWAQQQDFAPVFLQRQPHGRSQGDPLTYRRGSAESLARSPGGRPGAASAARLWRPGELKNNALEFWIDDPLRKACGWTQTCPSTQMLFPPLLSWCLCPPPACKILPQAEAAQPHLHLTYIHTVTDIKAVTAGTEPLHQHILILPLFLPLHPPDQDLCRFTRLFPHTQLMLFCSRNTSYNILLCQILLYHP